MSAPYAWTWGTMWWTDVKWTCCWFVMQAIFLDLIDTPRNKMIQIMFVARWKQSLPSWSWKCGTNLSWQCAQHETCGTLFTRWLSQNLFPRMHHPLFVPPWLGKEDWSKNAMAKVKLMANFIDIMQFCSLQSNLPTCNWYCLCPHGLGSTSWCWIVYLRWEQLLGKWWHPMHGKHIWLNVKSKVM